MTEVEKPAWLTPSLVVAVAALLTGGLGGAIFTYWMNHPEPSELAAVITTTSTGTNPATRSLVPELSLKIGDRDIPEIHIHTVDVNLASGNFLPKVDLAVTFAAAAVRAQVYDVVSRTWSTVSSATGNDSSRVEVFGSAFSAPTALHQIECFPLPNGFKCQLSPIDRQGAYRVQLATNVSQAPEVSIIGDNVRLLTGVQGIVAGVGRDSVSLLVLQVLALVLGIIAATMAIARYLRGGAEATNQ